MLSQQGLCCGSPGADRSTSCGRPQVYLRGWRMASRRRRRRSRRRRRRKRRKRSSNASVLAVPIDWQLFAGALFSGPNAASEPRKKKEKERKRHRASWSQRQRSTGRSPTASAAAAAAFHRPQPDYVGVPAAAGKILAPNSCSKTSLSCTASVSHTCSTCPPNT